jgi:hypothetical protein
MARTFLPENRKFADYEPAVTLKRVAPDGAALCCLVRKLLRAAAIRQACRQNAGKTLGKMPASCRRCAGATPAACRCGPLPVASAGPVSVDEEAPVRSRDGFFHAGSVGGGS